jgi:hypothetical protein
LEQHAQREAAGKLLVAAWRAGCLDDTPALAKLVQRHEEPTPPPQDGAQAVLVRCASNLFIEFCGNAMALVDWNDGSPTTRGVVPGVVDQYAPGMLPPTDPLVPWNDRVLDDQQAAVVRWLAERVEGLPVPDNCTEREADGEPVNSLRKTGNHWRITFAGQEALVDHGRGADHLYRLFQLPGRPIPTKELHGSVELADLKSTAAALVGRDNAGRLEELKGEWAAVVSRLERDDLSGLEERELREEKTALESEMARLKGLSGMPRTVAASHGDDVAVRKAIKAFAKVTRAAGLPSFADHVVAAVTVGSGVATYNPASPPDWQF